MEYSFTWLQENGGIMTDTDYPYKGYKSTCRSDASKYVDMTITGYTKLGSSSSTWDPVDEDEIKEFLYETGPLAVALNANPLQTWGESGYFRIRRGNGTCGINCYITTAKVAF